MDISLKEIWMSILTSLKSLPAIKDCYLNLKHPSSLQWPFSPNQSYIELDLYDAPFEEDSYSLKAITLRFIFSGSDWSRHHKEGRFSRRYSRIWKDNTVLVYMHRVGRILMEIVQSCSTLVLLVCCTRSSFKTVLF